MITSRSPSPDEVGSGVGKGVSTVDVTRADNRLTITGEASVAENSGQLLSQKFTDISHQMK